MRQFVQRMAATPLHSPVLKETAHHRQRSRPSARLNTESKIWSRRSACDSEALEGDIHYLAGLLRVLDYEQRVGEALEDEGFGNGSLLQSFENFDF